MSEILPYVFSRAGIGNLLGAGFDAEVVRRTGRFPRGARGRQLSVISDFGGQHRGQAYETYSFLICDLDMLAKWFSDQKAFRSNVLPSRRRMSFKAMNDRQRRNALVPFLNIADGINGWLVTFLVSKKGGSIFASLRSDSEVEERLSLWRPAVREKLMRVLHFSAFLLSGLSVAEQDVLWVIDEDDVASNDRQLTQLTSLFAHIAGAYVSRGLRHLRCATTRSDAGSLILEDLAAICDLSAGGTCELATSMSLGGRFSGGQLIGLLPRGLSWKTQWIAVWMAVQGGPLHRHTWLIDLEVESCGISARKINWHVGPHLLGARV